MNDFPDIQFCSVKLENTSHLRDNLLSHAVLYKNK